MGGGAKSRNNINVDTAAYANSGSRLSRRERLSELADQARSGSEKSISGNGDGYVALIGVEKLDHYHRLERERVHLLLLQDAAGGLADVAAGKVRPAREALAARRADR